jgi:UDP:flavonoid glycosyltransferase YjiC (YdhE family)
LNAIATVGRNSDPNDLGPQPPHFQRERRIPWSLTFPGSDRVVSYVGFNAIMAALAHGPSWVVIPPTAAPPDRARRIARRVVGMVIVPGAVSSNTVRDTSHAALNEPVYRRDAERNRCEMAPLPDPAGEVASLEQLVRARRPLVHG